VVSLLYFLVCFVINVLAGVLLFSLALLRQDTSTPGTSRLLISFAITLDFFLSFLQREIRQDK